MFELFLFWLFGIVTVVAAGLVVTLRNPVHAVLSLVLAFFSSAALWLLLEAEFLAITLVLVYVGAVMVLFLFVVMMLDINLTPLREGFARYLPAGAAVGVIIVVELGLVMASERFRPGAMATPLPHGPEYSNTRELGEVLYTTYVYPFEVAAVLLLVAIVAAIALTLRRRPDVRYTRPDEQVSVRREDRIRLVDMPAEQREP